MPIQTKNYRIYDGQYSSNISLPHTNPHTHTPNIVQNLCTNIEIYVASLMKLISKLNLVMGRVKSIKKTKTNKLGETNFVAYYWEYWIFWKCYHTYPMRENNREREREKQQQQPQNTPGVCRIFHIYFVSTKQNKTQRKESRRRQIECMDWIEWWPNKVEEAELFRQRVHNTH